ncbi:MAG: hypothetical protein FD136_262 [Chitinophagaceae bacterium]|nr:MAG: hypothetical protein FD136_262 [Chitinophagaceae bacterium]
MISLHSQSLNSLSGYYNIPTAEINNDGRVVAGAFYIPYRFSQEKGFDRDAISYFSALSYFPFLEMSLRFTKLLGPNYALGDRMFSFKLKFITEGKYIPSFSVGAQDFFHSTEAVTNRYNSLYLVITKNISVRNFINNISLTAGYGSDIIKANGHEYIGLFGGVSLRILEHLEFMFENDARFYNVGARIKLFEHIFLLGGYRDLKYFSGGGGVCFQL